MTHLVSGVEREPWRKEGKRCKKLLVLLQRLLAKVKARKSASKEEALRRHILFTQYIIGLVPYALDVQRVQKTLRKSF